MDDLFNNYWPENDFRYYLQHHGVKNQKWGVRNAEWYPIAAYQAHLRRTGGKDSNRSAGRIRASEGSSVIDKVKTKLKNAKYNRELKNTRRTLSDFKDSEELDNYRQSKKGNRLTTKNTAKNARDFVKELQEAVNFAEKNKDSLAFLNARSMSDLAIEKKNISDEIKEAKKTIKELNKSYAEEFKALDVIDDYIAYAPYDSSKYTSEEFDKANEQFTHEPFGLRGQKWGVERAAWYPNNQENLNRYMQNRLFQQHIQQHQDFVNQQFNENMLLNQINNMNTMHMMSPMGFGNRIDDAQSGMFDKIFTPNATSVKQNEFAKEFSKTFKKTNANYDKLSNLKQIQDSITDDLLLKFADKENSGDSNDYKQVKKEIVNSLLGNKHKDLSVKVETALESAIREKTGFFDYERAWVKEEDLKQDLYEDAKLNGIPKKQNPKYQEWQEAKKETARLKKVYEDNINNLRAQKEERINSKIESARKTDSYETLFLEAIQNDPLGKSNAPKKEILKEYRKYLNDPNKYFSEFEESDYARKYKSTKEYREIAKKVREKGWKSLTDKEKEIYEEMYV